jgi:dTDP-4-amino-4,6-dideoxygalactose transaminase
MTARTIAFQDLRPLFDRLSDEMADAVHRVLNSGWYVLGPEVEAFESEWAHFSHSGQAVAVANGTDAIELALRAAGIGPGDEVITVSHTAVATVCAIERAGARPVLVDIEKDAFTLDADQAASAVTSRTRAIVPVHLYGHPADMSAVMRLAERHHLLVVEDCAQAHAARWNGKLVGTFGDAGCFSFYPTKNLGACGDAGVVITSDAHLAERIRQLRSYGQATRGNSVTRGINSRLDELQAALLRVKLRHLEAHNADRRRLADTYNRELAGVVRTPREHPSAHCVYHLYVIRHAERDLLREALASRGIETLIHYPVPVHRQPAYADLGYPAGSLPRTEEACQQIVSLPLYVGLSTADVLRVCDATRDALAGVAP